MELLEDQNTLKMKMIKAVFNRIKSFLLKKRKELCLELQGDQLETIFKRNIYKKTRKLKI